jgi:serine/threonine protein kinase
MQKKMDLGSSLPVSSYEFYRVGKVLGRGAFGKVNLAMHKICQKLVAIKSIDVALLENQED